MRGRVVNAKNDQPLSGANVSIRFERLDQRYNWIDAGRFSATSSPDGSFSFANPDMQARFVAFAEHDGFYPNYDCPTARRLETTMLSKQHVLEIRLAPVLSPQPLPTGEGEVRFLPPGQRFGWNFAAHATASDSASDFVGEPDESGRRIAFLQALGKAGFVRAWGLSGEWALFNMPTAPQENYLARVDLREVPAGERAVFFVRTADGAHYAKIDLGATLQGTSFIGLRFYWVFQPNGSTALEIPLEKK